MSSLLCTSCLDSLHTKTAVSTTCGHIFCSECVSRQFIVRSACPVCRRAQTLEQLIRLYPEYGTASLEASSSGVTASSVDDVTPLQPEGQIPSAPHWPRLFPGRSAIPPSEAPTPSPSTTRTPSVHSLRLWIDVNGATPFPLMEAGVAPALDVNGSPIFLGLAAFRDGLHPCKICIDPQGRPLPFVSYGGQEYAHRGTTLLLPFDPATMEWVAAAGGQAPVWRRPVEGGYERVGREVLFHARAVVDGESVLGKAGQYGHMVGGSLEILGYGSSWMALTRSGLLQCGANVPYRGREHVIVRGYEVL